MTKASSKGAVYALMVEDNSDQKIQSKPKTYPLWHSVQKNFYPKQKNDQLLWKALLQSTWHFPSWYLFYGKSTIVRTDNKSFRRFFQTKAILPALWNACDYVLQFNFKLAHITGLAKTAADLLSGLELKHREKIRLKMREEKQKTLIEVTTSSSKISPMKSSFLHPSRERE